MNKEKIIKILKEKSNQIEYLILTISILIGLYLRSLPIPKLEGKYQLEVDGYLFLRYTEYIVENGKIMLLDLMRNYPAGYDPGGENIFLSYFIAYLYKIITLFLPDITVAQVTIIYPLITFILSMVLFFLLVKKLTNSEISLIATAYLVIFPHFFLEV